MAQEDEDSALALYIHWPYCLAKCPYCDFNSRKIPDSCDQDLWAKAYIKEIDYYAEKMSQQRVTSVYFGGGTPSLMKETTVASVLSHVAKVWSVDEACEITLEANPSATEKEKLMAFRAAGVNRLSLGVQSLRDEALRFLGRIHDAATARRVIGWASRIFPRYSFDLMYAYQGQTLDVWEAELKEALSFDPQHLSLYQLTIESNTPFYKRAQQEVLTASEDVSAALYEHTNEAMALVGLPAYEISNYATAGQESRHNLAYWRYLPYIGIGPGAHGRPIIGGQRYTTENSSAPQEWMAQAFERGHGLNVFELLDLATMKQEALMMGLRLAEGINKNRWLRLFDLPLHDFLREDVAAVLIEQKFAFDDKTAFTLTDEGRQRLDAIIPRLLPSTAAYL